MTGTTAASIARFDRVQVEMLECVYQHRLLSTAQLHALYRDGLSLRRTQRALAAMDRVGWLASVREPGGMKLWFVTEAGAEAVEAIGNRAELRRKLIPPEQAAGPLQQHTLAVNEVGVAFARAARERGDEFGPLAWRNEIAHPIGSAAGSRGRSAAVIADAVLIYEQETADSGYTHLRFLELDRATMATETLVAKLGRYVELHRYIAPAPSKGRPSGRYTGMPQWRERYSHFPEVMVVLANGSRSRLERRRWLTCARWKRLYAERAHFDLYVCLLEDLVEQGPFAPIFERGDGDELVDWLGEAPEPEEPVEPAPFAHAEEEPPEQNESEELPELHDYDEPAPERPAPYDDPEPVDDRRDGGRLPPLSGVDSAVDERDPWWR
jgi:Replication-relaxation